MVHTITPDTDLTALIASDLVSQGDVLLLQNGVYRQLVLIFKSYLRIIADGTCVVFDGAGAMSDAFFLIGTTGVEINGIRIKNYTNYGIAVVQGVGNRIVNNTVSDVGLEAIILWASSRNLVRDNELSAAAGGVLLREESVNNYVLGNRAKDCSDDGFESFLSVDANNSFIGNETIDCQQNGYEIFGANNLVYKNRATGGSTDGFLMTAGSSIIGIGNESFDNALGGFYCNSENAYLADNVAWRNERSGFLATNALGIYQGNSATCNQNGLLLIEQSSDNLVLRNCLARNRYNLVDEGTDNNLVQNTLLPPYRGGGQSAEAVPVEAAQTDQNRIEKKIAKIKEAVVKAQSGLETVPAEQRKTQEFLIGLHADECERLELMAANPE